MAVVSFLNVVLASSSSSELKALAAPSLASYSMVLLGMRGRGLLDAIISSSSASSSAISIGDYLDGLFHSCDCLC